MHQPRAGAAARGRGAAAGAGATPSWTPAASGCAAFAGGVVLPASRRARAVVPHTGAQGGGAQAAGRRRRGNTDMHVRVPASARCVRVVRPPGYVRVVRPRTGVGEAHTRLADAVVMDMRGPSRMDLPVRVPASELRACVQGCCSVQGLGGLTDGA